jgi:hypothetical protein
VAGEVVVSEYAQDVREPLTFSAAPPGWRALYVEDPDNTNHFTIPLLGWCLFRITVRDSDTGDLLPRARTQIEGAVLQGNEVVSVFNYSATSANFWWYLSPDEADPKPGTVPGRKPDGKGKNGKAGRGRSRRGPA